MKCRIILLLTLLIPACSREKASPFDMWDMRAGMPFAKLDSIAIHDQQERFTCVASVGKFRECVLKPRAIPSRMVAIIDSANRAVIISFHPNIPALGTSDGASVVIETELLRRRWKRTAPLTVDSSAGYANRLVESWMSEDRKYSAEIITGGSIYPEVVSTAYEPSARKFRALQVMANIPKDTTAALPKVEAELNRLLTAQDAHYARTKNYAATLDQLHFIPRDAITVTINAASVQGWWATATHARAAGRRCIIWAGSPPASGSDVRLGGTARTPNCQL